MGTRDEITTELFPREPESDEVYTFTKAAADGNLEEVKRILAERSSIMRMAETKSSTRKMLDINAISPGYPMTPLHAAVLHDHEDVVRFLLTQPGVDVNVRDTGGYTPLLLAAEYGNLSILKILFETSQVDRNATNKYDEDALMCAAKAGHPEMVEYLVPRVATISNRNRSGYTAVSLAAGMGHLEVVKELTTVGRRKFININERTEPNGRTVLMFAALSHNVDLVRYIIDTEWQQALDVNAIDFTGNTALMLAASEGLSTVVAELCNHGANVKHANETTAHNALMLASFNGHQDTVKVLLSQDGIDTMATDHLGRSALFLAAEMNRTECVKFILEKNKSRNLVNCVTNNGSMTPLTATNHDDIRLQLLRANGCDVTRLSGKQMDLRMNIQRAIIVAGEYNPDAWKVLLSKDEDFLLPVLALMAEDLIEEDLTKGFWEFFLEHPAGKEYHSGEKRDRKSNTLYHYIAKSAFAGKCTRVLQDLISEDNLPDVLRLRNKQDNNLLHTAAQCGNLKEIFSVIENIIEEDMCGVPGADIRENLKSENKDKQTFIAVAVKSKTGEQVTETVREIMKTLMNFKPRSYDMNFMFKTRDSGGNNLLHLAAKKENFSMISYLADKPVDESALDATGLNPLHIAVVENNIELFDHLFETFKHRFRINERTRAKETVVHIAAKEGHTEMLERIVKLGGDLSQRDKDGHTPLHDCLERVHFEGGANDRARCELFDKIWTKILEVAVIWWCGPSFLNIPIPDADSDIYKDFRRDAVYYLRSLVRNRKGYSALQYAAYLGLTSCVETMVTQQDVFVRKNENTCEYEIEITNLFPEYSADIEYGYWGYGNLKTEIQKKYRYKGKNTYFVDTVAKVKPPLKASEILRCVPMFRLTKWQWYVYQIFSIVWLVLHCSVMTVCSLQAQTDIREAFSPTLQNSSSLENDSRIGSSIYRENDTIDILVLIYTLVIFVLMAILPVTRLVRFLKKKFQFRKISQNEKPSYKIYHEYVEDKGAVLSSLTYVLAFLVEQTAALLSVCFALFAIGLFYSQETEETISTSYYAWMKGNFLLFGWLLALVPARTYSPIYNFLSTLKFIIIKDMIPFVIFYVIITVAFSCAMQLQFQLLTAGTVSDAMNASGFQGFFTMTGTVLYELVIMTTGLDTDLKHLQNVADLFHEDNQNSMFIEALLIVYSIISVIILLNMLIAMMGTTMTMVVDKHGTGWRQYQVIQALRIRNFLVGLTYCCRRNRKNCCGAKCKSSYRSVPQDEHGHQNDPQLHKGIFFDKVMQYKPRKDVFTGRWYLTLTRYELKQIRAQYWQSCGMAGISTFESDEALDTNQMRLNEVSAVELENMIMMTTAEDGDGVDGEIDNDLELLEPKESMTSLETRMTEVEKRLKSIENAMTSKLTNIEALLAHLKQESEA